MTAADAYPGLSFDGRVLRTIETPAGYLARGEQRAVTCERHLCRRHHTVDFAALIERGFANVQIRDLPFVCTACRGRRIAFTRYGSS